MSDLRNLEELKNLYEELDDDDEKKELVKNVIDSAEWFQETETDDSQNFNSYIDGCREDLDALLSKSDVEETLDLCDLFTQYLGNYVATEYIDYQELRPIYEVIVDGHLAMICDYGI